MSKVPCPHCLGVKTIVRLNKTRRGAQVMSDTCQVCNGEGEVTHKVEEDYLHDLHNYIQIKLNDTENV